MNTLLLIFRAMLFYLVPTMIGYALFSMVQTGFARKKTAVHRFLTKVEDKFLGESDLASAVSFLKLPWFFSIGTVFLLLSATAIAAIVPHLEPAFEFKQFFLPLVYGMFFVGSSVAIIKFMFGKTSSSIKELKPLSLLIGLSLIVAIIWNLHTPYSLNWDLYEHQTLARMIQEGHFNFLTVKMSDTFGFSSYPPSFHLLLALSQSLMGESPQEVLQYWQFLGYLHLITVSITSYYLGLAISHNRSVALLSGVIGTTIFESVIAFTSLFILPQTLTATVFAASFAGLLLTTEKTKNRVPAAIIVILAVSFILMHYVIGTLAALILVGSYLILYTRWLRNHLNWVTIGIIVASILGIIASYFINFSSINAGEAASYSFSLAEKFGYALSIYGASLFIFSLLGAWALFKSKMRYKQLWIIALLGFSALLVSNVPYVLKFYTIGRYFFHALMALGIVYLIKSFVKTPMEKLAIGVIIVTFLGLFTLNTASWKKHVFFEGHYTHVSQDDITAALFLQSYRKDHLKTLTLSDPTTMYLMEGLSGSNSPGGVFATVETRNSLHEAFSHKSVANMTDVLSTINDPLEQDSSRILILSGRTYKWYFADEAQRNAFDFNIWKPTPLTFYDRVELDSVISNTTEILYQNPSYVIIKLKQ